MKRRPLLPTLYKALFEVSTMREALGVLHGDLEAAEARHFLSRLDAAELATLQLIDTIETKRGVSAH